MPACGEGFEISEHKRGDVSLQECIPDATVVDAWITEVSTYLDEGNMPVQSAIGYWLEAAPSLTANTDTIAGNRGTMRWIKLSPNCPDNLHWDLGGISPETLQSGAWIAVPVGHKLTLPAAAKFSVHETSSLTEEQLNIASFEATSRLLENIAFSRKMEIDNEANPINQAEELEQKSLKRELSRFAQIFFRKKPEATFDTPLLKVMAAIGARGGFAVPATLEKTQDKSIENLCRLMGVHPHKVAVNKGDFLACAEPLLAFTQEGSPLAILPERSGKLYLYNGDTGTKEQVETNCKADISDTGYILAPLMPDRPMSIKEFLLFGLKANKSDMAAMIGAGFISAGFAMALPYGIGVAFSRIVPSSNADKLLELTLALSMIALVMFALDRTSALASLRMQGRAGLQLTTALWQRLLRFPGSFFGQHGAGDFMQRLSVAERMHQSVQTLLHSGVIRFQHFLASLIVMVSIFPFMALFMMGFAVLLFAASALTVYLQRKTIAQGEAFRGSAFNQTIELVGGISKIKAAGAQRWAFNQWAHNFSELRARSLRSRAVSNIFTSFTSGVYVVSLLIVFLMVAGPFAPTEKLEAGPYLAFIAALGTFTYAMIALAHMGARIAPLIGQKKRIKELLDTVPQSEKGKVSPGKLKGFVSVDGASFRYDSNGPLTLDNVSLQAQPGEFIAIVGSSGSGKSTLLKLILGALEPELGSIHFDGKDRRTLLTSALRRQIAAVTQFGQIMPGSIFDNIRGASECSLDEVWAAAEASCIAGDIRAMPMGMQTQVTQGASSFSGGQVQRLMVARAIAAKPKILILDEATSALDEPTQASVMKALEAMNVTRIMVAHRLSTIRDADRIYVLQGGEIVETGTFDALVQAGAAFAKLTTNSK